MTSRRPRLLVAALTLVGLALAPVALAHDGPDEHDFRDQDIDVTFTLPGFGFAELNFEAEEREEIDWTMTTDATTPPFVDVHTHNASVTPQFFTESNDTSIESTFVIPDDGTYSILIRSEQTAPAETTLTARGHFAFVSAVGFTVDIEADSPTLPTVIALGGLAVLAIAVAGARRR